MSDHPRYRNAGSLAAAVQVLLYANAAMAALAAVLIFIDWHDQSAAAALLTTYLLVTAGGASAADTLISQGRPARVIV